MASIRGIRSKHNCILELAADLTSDSIQPQIIRILSVPTTATFMDLHIAIYAAFQMNRSHDYRFSVLGSSKSARQAAQFERERELDIVSKDFGDQKYPPTVVAHEVTLQEIIKDFADRLLLYAWHFDNSKIDLIIRISHQTPGDGLIQCIFGKSKILRNENAGPDMGAFSRLNITTDIDDTDNRPDSATEARDFAFPKEPSYLVSVIEQSDIDTINHCLGLISCLRSQNLRDVRVKRVCAAFESLLGRYTSGRLEEADENAELDKVRSALKPRSQLETPGTTIDPGPALGLLSLLSCPWPTPKNNVANEYGDKEDESSG